MSEHKLPPLPNNVDSFTREEIRLYALQAINLNMNLVGYLQEMGLECLARTTGTSSLWANIHKESTGKCNFPIYTKPRSD